MERSSPTGGDTIIIKKKVIQSLILILLNNLPFRSNKAKLTIWGSLFLILEVFNSFSNKGKVL